MFQSRNRESSNFNAMSADDLLNIVLFQSRNRESSNFNLKFLLLPMNTTKRFNLVIENLLISTGLSRSLSDALTTALFQSRNRESSNFNLWRVLFQGYQSRYSFNLVIENLLISTVWICDVVELGSRRFNLVIENLLISTQSESSGVWKLTLFQSRNRESSNFNRVVVIYHSIPNVSFNLVI